MAPRCTCAIHLPADGSFRMSPPASKSAANRVHPTAKPVELIERALLNSSFLDQRAGQQAFSRGPCVKRRPICRCSVCPTRPAYRTRAQRSRSIQQRRQMISMPAVDSENDARNGVVPGSVVYHGKSYRDLRKTYRLRIVSLDRCETMTL